MTLMFFMVQPYPDRMFPREHGAYGQMIAPIVASLFAGRPTMAALLVAVAIVAAFVAHEPLLVLIGRRGTRARREQGSRAWRWLVASGGVALAAATATVFLMPADARWTLLLPLPFVMVLGIAMAWGHEKSTVAEVAVALAFSFASVPVARAAGLAMSPAFAIALVFAAMFVTSTLAVRAVILGSRGGGNPGAQRITRMAAALSIAAILVSAVVAAMRGWMSAPMATAFVPGLVVASGLVVAPPPASALRRAGWTLVGATVATVVILIVVSAS
jgi:hypothetical protein